MKKKNVNKTTNLIAKNVIINRQRKKPLENTKKIREIISNS